MIVLTSVHAQPTEARILRSHALPHQGLSPTPRAVHPAEYQAVRPLGIWAPKRGEKLRADHRYRVGGVPGAGTHLGCTTSVLIVEVRGL